MEYTISEGLVCRDVAGVYFVIDIHDKHFYRNKEVNNVNEIAYALICIMNEQKKFTVASVTDALMLKLNPNEAIAREMILTDVQEFIDFLMKKGWIYV